ncbi:1-phosphatidylinositol 3-phosphate 5-kinase [Phytophthora cinnamomi]|uniref:1-phosphatidylinositol 3-phosphate 5-kinase n=1 Tax=Phytophthora cinnamomi TaxID=4785 RepID=UPI00355A7518|nr:1-phosphatidylinositol 3-phosphate 5-kinase [Phytophthora cinnamomi]
MSSAQTSSRRSNSSDSASTVAGPVSVAGTTNGYGFRSAGGDALSIEMQFLNPRRRFPLADEFLPAVHVTEEQVEDLCETCEQLTADALELTSMFAWEDSNNNDLVNEHRDQWKVHYKRPHVTLYRKKRGKDAAADELEDSTGDSNGGLRHYVVSGQIHDMSLEDVEYGLYCDATLDERAVMTDLYRELFLDAAVLRSFETQTPEDPFHFFGIKWLAHLSPADKFISPRDFAFVEYSRRVAGPKGEPLLVKVQQSLGLEHVDAMNRREFDLVRAQMSCTTVYRHDKRANNVQVIARGYLDPCGSAPALMTRSFLTRLAPTLVEVEHSADVKYIMRHGLVLPKEQFFARREALKAHGRHRLQCTACGKRFGRLKRHLTQCRACGEAACGRCLMTYTLCLPHHECRSAEHPSAVIPERFCLRCLYSGRLDRKGQRMDDFLTGGRIGPSAPSTTVPTVDDDDEADDDDVSVVEFAMLGDGSGNPMHAAISEAQRLQRLKQRYLENEKRKYLSGHQQTPVQRIIMEQQHQMHHYEQATRRAKRPPITRTNSQPMLNGSVGSSSISSAHNSVSSAYSSLSMTSSTYSSAEAAAAATAALQATTGFHEMEHSIGEQEALLRSLQTEYAKLSVQRAAQRSHSNPSFNAQQMRDKRLAEWEAAERSQAMAPPASTFNQYDIDD